MNRFSTILLAILATISIAFASAPDEPQPANHDTRVIYVVRHAEKDSGDNPPLSQAGIERAARLARMLAHEPIAGVFVTQTTRSAQTGEPVADHHGIDTVTYAPFGYEALGHQLNELPEDSSALVVAHSNTVSPILEALGAEPVGDIPEDEYTRLYALILRDGLHTKTIRLAF